MACETIPEMRARYERTIADLQGQIEQLTLDLEFERRARERVEAQLQLVDGAATELARVAAKLATTP